MIYLDHNASSPLDENVLEAMLPFLSRFHGNPSSLHRMGRLARSAVEIAREQVASLVHCQPSQVIFTSGGSEANNMAISSLTKRLQTPEYRWASGTTEHASVLKIATALPEWSWIPLNVNSQGIVNIAALDQLLEHKPAFVSLMWANNETGVLQDIPAIASWLREYNIPLHCDAVQAVGKIPVDFAISGLQAMSISAHKLNGPKGSGALIVNKPREFSPLILGGGQESGLRSGTENVAAIVGFGKACELAEKQLATRSQELLQLRLQLETGLRQLPGTSIFAETAARLPNTVMFGAHGYDGEMLLMQLDKAGIAASSGSACDSAGREPSHVLQAMQVSPELARSAIRFSMGAGNTPAEIGQALGVLGTLLA